MISIPTTSIAKLSSLRGRERLFRVFWGVTRWVSLVLTLFTLAIIADWWIDKYQDTPRGVRIPLMFAQLIAASVAALFWIVFPWTKGPSLIRLARRVEERIPEYDHRLITSIQLTRREARTEGMSRELIQIVTTEAESISNKHNFTALADTRRLKWSLGLLVWPIGICIFLLAFFGPALLGILFKRQLLANIEIPRDIQLTAVTKKNPWPAGDEVTLRYEVISKGGKLDKDMKGKVFVSVEGQPVTEYDLSIEDPDAFTKDRAVFSTKVAHSSKNFNYRARFGDGRTKASDLVTFEPRPTISVERAWVQMPDYVPGRPVVEQEKGDIKAYNGSRARVRILVQKPITDAKLMLYRRGDDGASEVLVTSLDMERLDPVKLADGSVRYPAESEYFDLLLAPGVPRLVAYRVTVRDEYDFASADNPRRTIDIKEPELPFVKLVKERFSLPGVEFSEDDVLEGLPIPLGGSIKVEYFCRSNVGLKDPNPGMNGRLIAPARFVYRINDEEEHFLPLDEIPETPESGEYDILKASFTNLDYQKTALKGRVEFHAKPAKGEATLGRIEGGGIFDFNIAELKKKGPEGREMELEVGDRISYRIEVFDRDPAPGRPPGRSEEFTREVQTKDEVFKRAFDVINSEQKIRDLEKKQQGVFVRPKTQ